jgi:hypothetical protein
VEFAAIWPFSRSEDELPPVENSVAFVTMRVRDFVDELVSLFRIFGRPVGFTWLSERL